MEKVPGQLHYRKAIGWWHFFTAIPMLLILYSHFINGNNANTEKLRGDRQVCSFMQPALNSEDIFVLSIIYLLPEAAALSWQQPAS